MLASVIGALWVASVSFINPFSGKEEVSRFIPVEGFQNNVQTCMEHLGKLANGADALGMDIVSAYCQPWDTKANGMPQEHKWFGVVEKPQ